MGAADNMCGTEATTTREGRCEVRFDELRQRVGAGEYEVDTRAVADALLRHWSVTDLGAGRRHTPLGGPPGAQLLPCSYPCRPVASASVNDSPRGPSRTSPIHVIGPSLAASSGSAASSAGAAAGRQAQSS